MATDAPQAEQRIALADLPGYSDLVIDYLYDFERVAAYYKGGKPDQERLKQAVGEMAARSLPREEVSQILIDQNERWGMPEAVLENARKLAQPDSAVVVTGQQVGIFGGPLYTIYKTITAIRLAKELSESTGKPVIPVFWVQSEDHDFEEIAAITVLRRNETESLTYDGQVEGNAGAVGRLALTSDITRMLDELEEMLPPSDFHDELFEALREAYQPERSIADAFVAWWKRLFADHGLVFINPDDRRLKELAIPLFERELRNPKTSAGQIEQVSEGLRADGYHAQVHSRPTNLFLMDKDARLPVDVDGDAFVLRGTERRFTTDELLDLMRSEPERFSPNVVLRPLMQDSLLPTASYVGGPGEVAYFAQYRGVYDWAELRMPVISPRATATLVEPKVQKVFDRYEVSITDLAPGIDEAFGRLVRQLSSHDLESEFSRMMTAVHKGISDLKPSIENVDHSLGRSTEATRASIVKEIERLKERVFRAEKRHHDEVRSQLEKTWINVLPAGRLQERVISPIYFLNKYGFGLIDRLFESLDASERDHQVIAL